MLSRVTLGADVAVTSVLLDAAKTPLSRMPRFFSSGPQKISNCSRLIPASGTSLRPMPRSSSLRDRLRASAALWIDDGIVIDPDSRLTQLGLISVCEDASYFFFESRGYGGDGVDRLPALAARWAREVFGVADARPYIAPLPATGPPADITVSLGVGENQPSGSKAISSANCCALLAETGASVLVDKGGSEEERARVEAALQPGMRTHDGAFAPFAAQIARSKLFVGYDSAGGHVASACGVPLISIAKGFASERMPARWRPNGTVLDGRSIPDVLGRGARSALTYTFRR